MNPAERAFKVVDLIQLAQDRFSGSVFS